MVGLVVCLMLQGIETKCSRIGEFTSIRECEQTAAMTLEELRRMTEDFDFKTHCEGKP